MISITQDQTYKFLEILLDNHTAVKQLNVLHKSIRTCNNKACKI